MNGVQGAIHFVVTGDETDLLRALSSSRSAINSADQRTLFADIHAARLKFVENIVRRDPTQARFLKGWKNRINDIKFEA